MAEKDRRTYVRLHDGLTDHPKIVDVGGEAAWLYVSILCYTSRQLTDGLVPRRLVRRLTDLANPEALASALLRVGLLHEGVHDCPRCPLGGPDNYVVHDYLEHQRSAAEVAELRAKRSAAGQRGGKRSGETRRAAANTEANEEALASHLVKQTRSKTEAETETETEREEVLRTSSTVAPIRIDVEQACTLLADLIEANGTRRPTITQAWRDAARRMLDRDHIALTDVLGAIRWSQADEFWRCNILSMPKLRKQYPTLRLQAQRGRTTTLAPTGTDGYAMSTADRRVQQAAELAARLAAEENQ